MNPPARDMIDSIDGLTHRSRSFNVCPFPIAIVAQVFSHRFFEQALLSKLP
jgi:hypothetical protein